jgi:TPR repeat protein
MFNLGVLRVEQGKTEEAEELYQRAADAGDTTAMFNLGVLREKQGKTGEASTDGRPTPGTPSPWSTWACFWRSGARGRSSR